MNRFVLMILALMRLDVLLPLIYFFGMLGKLNSEFFDLNFKLFVLYGMGHVFLFKLIYFLNWVELDFNNVIVAETSFLGVAILSWLVSDSLLNWINNILIF